MEPEAHGGAMWPVLRGAGESSGLLEVIAVKCIDVQAVCE